MPILHNAIAMTEASDTVTLEAVKNFSWSEDSTRVYIFSRNVSPARILLFSTLVVCQRLIVRLNCSLKTVFKPKSTFVTGIHCVMDITIGNELSETRHQTYIGGDVPGVKNMTHIYRDGSRTLSLTSQGGRLEDSLPEVMQWCSFPWPLSPSLSCRGVAITSTVNAQRLAMGCTVVSATSIEVSFRGSRKSQRVIFGINRLSFDVCRLRVLTV